MIGVARFHERAIAIVRCGKHIIRVGGYVSSASRTVFANHRAIARLGDSVVFSCGKVGRIYTRLAKKTYVDWRPVGLRYSGVFGPGILRGWITSGSMDVFAA